MNVAVRRARPATEDYGPRIARGEVWLMELTGESVAVLMLEPHHDST